MPYNGISFASEALFGGCLKGEGIFKYRQVTCEIRSIHVLTFCVCLTLPISVWSSGCVALLGWESGFLCCCLLASVVGRSRVCVVCVGGSCPICECFRVGIAYVNPGSARGCDSVAVFYVLWGGPGFFCGLATALDLGENLDLLVPYFFCVSFCVFLFAQFVSVSKCSDFFTCRH
jgi:hypothetical protein